MSPTPEPARARPADWEAFYRDYRKPGYVEGFEITSKLGGGMFGLVFRARRMSIGKDYAIKFLRVDDGEVRDAIVAELEQVRHFAQIDHPNLVSIEDRGEVDGIPYLVMAFAGTETLKDRMPAGEPPSAEHKDELLRLFLQCCRGLAALHERALVHFDVKPANVFLKGGVARLGDYGLSKLVTHSRGSLSMGRGTPYYMAPELLQRRGDHRSDIYSLGVVLYELLCGRVPFTGDTEWEVLRHHERTPPPLPAHLTSVERVVLQRCLAKAPADRFQSVYDLIAAFGAPSLPGAATFRDVRDGAVAGAGTAGVGTAGVARAGIAAPPPRGAAATGAAASGLEAPGAAADEDPYAAMARASREAFRNANVVARHAWRDAQRVAREAAQKARQAWHESFAGKHAFGLSRWHERRRLRRQAKEQRARERAAAAAAARGGVWRTFVTLTKTVAVLLVTLAVLVPLWLTGRPMPMAIATSQTGPAPQPDGRSTFRAFTVPTGYQGLVSTSEPEWSRRFARDPKAAKQLLLQHIERLRRAAPVAPDARASVGWFPSFGMDAGLQLEAASVRVEVLRLLAAPEYDRAVARRITAAGPVGLATVAQVFSELPWTRRDDLERASRLQRVLVEATDCKDLQLVTDERLTPAQLEAYNRPLGHLWIWFVNEFAHSERAWQAYRQLLGV